MSDFVKSTVLSQFWQYCYRKGSLRKGGLINGGSPELWSSEKENPENLALSPCLD